MRARRPEPTREGTARRALPLLAILALGVASAALYEFALVRPYLLTRYVEQPLLDLGKIGGYDPAAGWRYALPLLALWIAYGAVGALAPHVRRDATLLAVAFGGTLGLAALLLRLYPITAADIFNYVLYGLVPHRGANPLVTPPASVIGPPLIEYSAWPDHVSPYGPVWQGLAWLVTALSGERLLAGLLGFKAVLLALHLLNTALIARLAAVSGAARPGVAALIYGWNPLLLYETVGNGHNDVAILMGLLLALCALSVPRRAALALPLATLAALAKYSGALWLPVLALGWLPAQLHARRWRAILASLVACVLLVALCYAPFWAGAQTLAGVRRQSDLYTTSLGGLVMTRLATSPAPPDPALLLDLVKRVALALVALALLICRPRDSSITEVARGAYDVTLAYLLLGALWFQPWYLVPLVGLAPLVGPARRLLAACYALGATGSYVVYFYLWPALDWTPDRFLIQAWATGVAHGPVLLALALLTARALAQRRPRPNRPNTYTILQEH